MTDNHIRNVFGETVPCNPTLGICLPVYRRPELLRRSLASIIESARAFNVPIFISDDSCDDTNRAVLEESCRNYPPIAWHRNSGNLGIDRNIAQSIELTSCRYAWVMGEDDVMVPDAVSSVMSVLARGSYPYVFVNYMAVSNDYARIVRPRAIELEEDREFEAADFLSRFGWATGFLGSCVIERRCWDSVDRTPYVGTFFAHVGTIFEGVKGRRIFALARPLVGNRAENAASFTWSNDAVKVVFGWQRLLDLLVPHYGKDVIDGARRASRGTFKSHSLVWLLSRRADGAFTIREWRRYIRDGGENAVYRLCALLVSVFPRQVLVPIKRALRP